MKEIKSAIKLIEYDLKEPLYGDGIHKKLLTCLAALKTVDWISNWTPSTELEVRHIKEVFKELRRKNETI